MRPLKTFLLVSLGLSSPALAETVLINTDSTVGGATISAQMTEPPLPERLAPARLEDQQALAQTSVAPSADRVIVQPVRVLPGSDSVKATPLEKRVGLGLPPLPEKAQEEDKESQAEPVNYELADNQANELSDEEPILQPIAKQSSWSLKPGMLREQLAAWGKEDPLWEVIWEGDADLEVEVSHTFYKDLDEAVIDVVKAFAATGMPIRVQRAKANHMIIVRSGS